MNTDEWIEWRGGAHVMPVAAGCTYREYCAPVQVGCGDDPWGEGLLDYSRFADPGLKHIEIDSVHPESDAELLVFGTGVFQRPVWVNGCRVNLQSTNELAMGRERYEAIGNSVHRAYQLALIPRGVLRNGTNTVQLLPTHAFVQVLVVRVFDPPVPDEPGAGSSCAIRLVVETADDAYTLSTSGSVRAIDYFVRSWGMDLDLTGSGDSWQTYLNPVSGNRGAYVIEGRLGGRSFAGHETHRVVRTMDGCASPISFRCRVTLDDGRIVESPGGAVPVVDGSSDPARLDRPTIIRPRRFYPYGFHANGWHQDYELLCEYTVPEHPGARWRLMVPHYGAVAIEMNGGYTARADMPTGRYAVSIVDLPDGSVTPGLNLLRLCATGATGCYQPPGPVLVRTSGGTRD
jgi:hypothetical protein